MPKKNQERNFPKWGWEKKNTNFWELQRGSKCGENKIEL